MNETIHSYTTQVTAISSTATVASNGFNGSTEVTSLSSTQHKNYPLADGVLFASFSTSISSASNICVLYRRDLNIDGSNDAPQPQSAAPAYSSIQVGVFTIPPFTATSTVYVPLPDIPLSQNCEFYLENKTNASIVSGFTLKLTPKTVAPSPT